MFMKPQKGLFRRCYYILDIKFNLKSIFLVIKVTQQILQLVLWHGKLHHLQASCTQSNE